jgi:nitrite reductase (NADH) small subunit
VTTTRRLVAVARVEDVPLHEGRAVVVDGRRIAIFRTPSGVRALDGDCPHRGGPLADGLVGDDCVTCPLHGRRIDLATGEVTQGGRGAVRVHPVRERDGWIYLDAG